MDLKNTSRRLIAEIAASIAGDCRRVAEAAVTISRLDFQVTISRYVNAQKNSYWVITVGESRWQRHLVVKEIGKDNSAIKLGVLKERQRPEIGYQIDINDLNGTVTLEELTMDGYEGVRLWLKPAAQEAGCWVEPTKG